MAQALQAWAGHSGSDALRTEGVGLAAKGGKEVSLGVPKLNNHSSRETYFFPVKMYECQKGSCIFLNTKCNLQKNKNVLNWTSVSVALPAQSCRGGTKASGVVGACCPEAKQWVLKSKWG